MDTMEIHLVQSNRICSTIFWQIQKAVISTIQFPVPNNYRLPKGYTLSDYQNECLEK